MALANYSEYRKFPERPLDPPPSLPECNTCRGFGVVLGTDTPDSWGEPCECGVDFRRPVGIKQSHELHSAHMQARLVKAKS